MGWRIPGGAAAALAGTAARKALVLGWKKTTGKEPPANPASPGTQWSQAIAWAVLSDRIAGTRLAPTCDQCLITSGAGGGTRTPKPEGEAP